MSWNIVPKLLDTDDENVAFNITNKSTVSCWTVLNVHTCRSETLKYHQFYINLLMIMNLQAF